MTAEPAGPQTPAALPNTRSSLARFFALALVISWMLWWPRVAARYGWWGASTAPYWHLAGSLGPAIAAGLTARHVAGAAGVRVLLHRAQHWRAGLVWWVVAVAGPLLLFGLAAAAVDLTVGHGPTWTRVLSSAEYPDLPPSALVLVQIACYGFGEEIGWRGFALPRLLARMRPLAASMLLSVPWAIWHLPLLVTNDTYRQMSAVLLLGWGVSLTTGSVLLTWLFLGSGGSVLLVAVFHALLDLVMVNRGVSDAMVPVMGALVTMWGLVAGVVLTRRHTAPSMPSGS